MENHKKKSLEILSALFSCFVYLCVLVPYFFGLGYSFYRFGVGDGVASIIIPPYAWYRGISVCWMEPKWKEDWGPKTEALAFFAIYPKAEKLQYDLDIKKNETKLKKWLKRIPDAERNKLKTDLHALGNAFIEYGNEFVLQITMTGNVNNNFISSPAIQRYVNKFRREKSFFRVWEKFKTQQKHMMKNLQERINENSDPAEVGLRSLEYMKLQGNAEMKMNAELLHNRIEFLFD